jgi:hypothetical protein
LLTQHFCFNKFLASKHALTTTLQHYFQGDAVSSPTSGLTYLPCSKLVFSLETPSMNGAGPGQYGQPPAAWQEHRTADGRSYYYNSVTKVTQWTKPDEMMTQAEVRTINAQKS